MPYERWPDAKGGKAARLRLEFDNGCITALRLWRIPSPVSPGTHSFKYALFYGRPGEGLVLFDNERGKGDHKHILEVEGGYEFTTLEKLIEDFQAAVQAVRERKSV